MSALKIFEKMNKLNLRVLIDGNGADEIMGGYQQHIDAYNNNFLNYKLQKIQGIKFDYAYFKNADLSFA